MVRVKILCRLFGHRFSRVRAFRVREQWKSYCKRCGVPMTRISSGAWEANVIRRR